MVFLALEKRFWILLDTNQVVKVLSAEGGACAMVARSVEIRQRTCARLAATAGRQG